MKKNLALFIFLVGCNAQTIPPTTAIESNDIKIEEAKAHTDLSLCERVLSWRNNDKQSFPSMAFNELLARHPDWKSKSHALTAPPPEGASSDQIQCLWGKELADIKKKKDDLKASPVSYGPPPPKKYQALVVRAIKEKLKDPDSLKDLSIGKPYKATLEYRGTGKTSYYYAVCARYNAKNSYGGYTGTQGEVYYFIGQIPFSILAGYRLSDNDPAFAGDCYP